MLTLLLGPDDFSKDEYVQKLAKNRENLAVFDGMEGFPPIEHLTASDLFGGTKVYVLKNLLKQVNNSASIAQLTQSSHHFLIVEEKLDKRLAENKSLLANKQITVK